MPVVTRLAYRKPTREVTQKPTEPRPISTVGSDRQGAVNAFTEGYTRQ